MIVCPVCEHQQVQGAECEVCGRDLAAGAAAAPDVAALDGLEPTSVAAPADAPVERMGDLEPTAFRAAPDPLPEPLPLEETRVAPVDVAVEPAPEIERLEAAIPDDAPTEVPLFVTCRYCRTEAMPGERVCARCGMRLPDFGGPRRGEELPVRICGCGMAVRGTACPACGARR